jgi:hypothetical protein
MSVHLVYHTRSTCCDLTSPLRILYRIMIRHYFIVIDERVLGVVAVCISLYPHLIDSVIVKEWVLLIHVELLP